MTTITVAHRVKTIMNSDIIYVLDKGGIAESGKFRELSMSKNYVEEQQDEVKDDYDEEQNIIKRISNKETLK